MSNDVLSTADLLAQIQRVKPSTGVSAQEFTADLLAYEGIQVNLTLGRGMTAKHAIKSLYTEKFHSRVGDTAPVRQLTARLAECLNLEMLTFTVLTKAGHRARAGDTITALRRST